MKQRVFHEMSAKGFVAVAHLDYHYFEGPQGDI